MARGSRRKILDNTMEETGAVNDFSKSIANLVSEINKKISESGDGAFILGAGSSPTEIPYYISTGSTVLDTIIANKPNGGIPVRKITEIFGEPSSGKSLICGHIIANTQKMNGLAVLIDTESATNPEFLQKIGVDLSKLVWIKIQTTEKVFETIEQIIKNLDKIQAEFVTIIWDSLAATSDENEMEQGFAAKGFGMNKAKSLSRGFRQLTQQIADKNIALVVTNQIRDNIGVMFGDKKTTTGGWALKFYSSLRLKVTRNGRIKEKITLPNMKVIEEIRGVYAKVFIEKSRVGPPFRDCSFNIYFNKGIDDRDSWFEALVNRGVIERPTTQKYSLKLKDGTVLEFKQSAWKKVVKENHLEDYIKELIVDSHIIKYDSFDNDDEEEFPEEIVVEQEVPESEEVKEEQDVYLDDKEED